VTPDEFTQRVIQATHPSIVIFGITDGVGERTTRDTVQAAREFATGTTYRVHVIDIGHSAELAEEFLIMASPTIVVIHQGTPVAQATGSQSVEEIARLTAGAIK